MNQDNEAPSFVGKATPGHILLHDVIAEWVGGGLFHFTKPDLLKSEVKGIMSRGMVSNSCTLQ